MTGIQIFGCVLLSVVLIAFYVVVRCSISLARDNYKREVGETTYRLAMAERNIDPDRSFWYDRKLKK